MAPQPNEEPRLPPPLPTTSIHWKPRSWECVAKSPPGLPWLGVEDLLYPPRADPSHNPCWFSEEGRVDQLAPPGASPFPSAAKGRKCQSFCMSS